MKTLKYSSLAAFLAHYLALMQASALSEGERETLDQMERIVGLLANDERTSLAVPKPSTGAARRHRERAERRLRHELAAREILSG